MHEGHAAQKDAGGETGQIADHAAAEGDDGGAPLAAGLQHGVEQAFQMGEALGLLAGRQNHAVIFDPGSVQGVFQRLQMQPFEGFVGHHEHPSARQQGRQPASGFGQQSRPDHDVIGAITQRDGNIGDGGGHDR